MRICNEVLNGVLSSMPSTPPEAGGIIGGKDGQIFLWEFDSGYKESGCIYRPNVYKLNAIIDTWTERGYEFMGILHVHFGGSRYLSGGDKEYIEKIMRAMPNSINQLYFPIVVQPERELISYLAVRNLLGEITISSDKVEIILKKTNERSDWFRHG